MADEETADDESQRRNPGDDRAAVVAVHGRGHGHDGARQPRPYQRIREYEHLREWEHP